MTKTLPSKRSKRCSIILGTKKAIILVTDEIQYSVIFRQENINSIGPTALRRVERN